MAEGHNPIHLVLGTWELPKRATQVLARGSLIDCFIFIYLSIISKFSAIFISSHHLTSPVSPLLAFSCTVADSSSPLVQGIRPEAAIIGSQDLESWK